MQRFQHQSRTRGSTTTRAMLRSDSSICHPQQRHVCPCSRVHGVAIVSSPSLHSTPHPARWHVHVLLMGNSAATMRYQRRWRNGSEQTRVDRVWTDVCGTPSAAASASAAAGASLRASEMGLKRSIIRTRRSARVTRRCHRYDACSVRVLLSAPVTFLCRVLLTGITSSFAPSPHAACHVSITGAQRHTDTHADADTGHDEGQTDSCRQRQETARRTHSTQQQTQIQTQTQTSAQRTHTEHRAAGKCHSNAHPLRHVLGVCVCVCFVCALCVLLFLCVHDCGSVNTHTPPPHTHTRTRSQQASTPRDDDVPSRSIMHACTVAYTMPKRARSPSPAASRPPSRSASPAQSASPSASASPSRSPAASASRSRSRSPAVASSPSPSPSAPDAADTDITAAAHKQSEEEEEEEAAEEETKQTQHAAPAAAPAKQTRRLTLNGNMLVIMCMEHVHMHDTCFLDA